VPVPPLLSGKGATSCRVDIVVVAKLEIPETVNDPFIAKVLTGILVPIPTFPLDRTVSREAPVEEAMLKGFREPLP
jgi:hypothetical protein